MPEITMKQLLQAGVHFGHQTTHWNPKMKKYIHSARNGIHIVDLQKTLIKFREAELFIKKITEAGKKILFVATKRQAQEIIKQEAERCGMYFVNQRWLGGTMTNFSTIRKSIDRLLKLEKMEEEGEFERLHKKEALNKRKEIEKLNKFLGGIKKMRELPHALFIIDTQKEKIALAEAKILGIKTFALVDTNCDPVGIDFPFPGNDDAVRAINLFTTRVADIVLEGQEVFQAGRKETEKPEEQKPEPPVKPSNENDQGEKATAEVDQSSKNDEGKIPV
ncbi:MAG TPA: 30S ribosomal protein S2 [Nitrospinaceae bacterium]|jgi:small subunit ribosomal protein S2|nr:30S ribosomal protein S2 [Nitrospinaceae bacterium]